MQRQDDDSDEQTTAAPRIISRTRAESEEEDEAPQDEEEEDDELREARRAAVRERCAPYTPYLQARSLAGSPLNTPCTVATGDSQAMPPTLGMCRSTVCSVSLALRTSLCPPAGGATI